MAERRESAPFCLSVAEAAPTSYRLTKRGRGHAAAGEVCISRGCRVDCLSAWMGERHREGDSAQETEG